MVHVKICGITRAEDAMCAVGGGADALGFVFFKDSPRYVEPEVAAKIIRALPPFVTPVGVFADADEAFVSEALSVSGVRVLQFHGSETPAFCRSFGVPYVKGFRVRDMQSLEGIEGYDASAYLLDAYSEKELGGTGMSFNWDVAVYAKRFGPIILAGGLTPENVAQAIRQVRPYAVDVSSGIEASKGRKDHAALMRFIAEARVA